MIASLHRQRRSEALDRVAHGGRVAGIGKLHRQQWLEGPVLVSQRVEVLAVDVVDPLDRVESGRCGAFELGFPLAARELLKRTRLGSRQTPLHDPEPHGSTA